MKLSVILIAVIIYILPSCIMSQGLTLDEQIHDFGHVGIDFIVKHVYTFENRTDVPIKIKDIIVTCDCTQVKSADTLIQPGDTAFFHLSFDTKDYYGPTNKSFSVITDHPQMPKLEYFYLSIVGQWFNGLKPRPISVFFLPSKKSKVIKIPNKAYNEISVVFVSQVDDLVSTKIVTAKASKGNFAEVEVTPKSSLDEGTYHSTVRIGLQTDEDEITWFSIPIKIVIY